MSRTVHTRYADILEESSAETIVARLDALYRVDAPRGLGDAIDASLRARAVPKRRRGRIVALLLAALLLAGAGYASGPIVARLWSHDPGAAALWRAGLVRELSLAETVDGVTVRVDRAYADRNRILVGYSVQLPQERAAGFAGFTARATLTDAEGRAYPVGPISFGDQDPAAGISGHLFNFDASALSPDESEVAFELTVAAVRAIRVQAASANSARFETIATGPWSFRFTLPIGGGRIAEVHETIVQDGVALTLERAVVTPSETRLYVRFEPSAAGSGREGWSLPLGRVAAAGREAAISAVRCETDGRCVLYVHASLNELAGPFTLRIDELVQSDGVQSGRSQKHTAGPWLFRFDPR